MSFVCRAVNVCSLFSSLGEIWVSLSLIVSKGLSDCTMENILFQANSTVDVQKIEPGFKLCCEDKPACTLCLVIEVELLNPLDKNLEVEDHSGGDEDYKETMGEKRRLTFLLFHYPI